MKTLTIAISVCFGLAAAFGQSAAPLGQSLTCRNDALHRKQWVTLRDPQRPWLPPRVVPAEGLSTGVAARACAPPRSTAQPAKKIVKAGAMLRVIYQQDQLRTITPGTALASGSRGQVIRVRVLEIAGTRVVDAEVLDATTARRRN